MMTTQRPDDAEPLYLMILPKVPMEPCRGLRIFTQRSNNTESSQSHASALSSHPALDRPRMLHLC